MAADSQLKTRAAIIAHLESLTLANSEAVRRSDFSSIDNITFDKPLPRFADEAPGQRFTATEAFYLAKNLCQAYPEYDPKIIDMVTTLEGSEDDDLKNITKAQTFFPYQRSGIPPGTIASSVMIVRYRCKNGHWATESYERMPGGNILGGMGFLRRSRFGLQRRNGGSDCREPMSFVAGISLSVVAVVVGRSAASRSKPQMTSS